MNRSVSRRLALKHLGAAAVTAAAFPCAPRAFGETPPRLVSLELQLTEVLVALGAPPVAAADNALYRRLVGAPALPPEVADLGPVQQPNLEYLQYLKPDVIVAPAWESAALRSAVARVAPLERIGDLSEPSAVERLFKTTRRLGVLARRETAAEELIRQATAAFAPDSSLADRPTLLCRFYEDGRHLAVFGSRSVMGDVAARIGVMNAWSGRQNAFGTAVAAVEDLARYPDARLIHFDRGAETGRALARLERSPLWRALPSVRRGDVIATPVVHPNGGVASAMRLAAQLRRALSAHG